MPSPSQTLGRLLGSLALPLPLLAQVATGVALFPDSVTPAARVLVEVRTSRGRTSRVLTDARGAFRVRLAQADTATVRLLRPGLRPTVDVPRFVDAGREVDVRLVLSNNRVALAAVTVTATPDRTCRENASGAQLWREARTVLHSAVLTERDTAMQIRAVEYEGPPQDDGSVAIVDSTLRVVPLAERFGRPHYDSLYRFGFIRRNAPGVTTYYAPNAELLADERFIATHCFLTAPEDTVADDLIGVRFEPLDRPRYTDVAGTVWLDVETYELRRIEFSYVNPPLRHRVDGTGGEIEFARLPTGHWITREWTMRTALPSKGDGARWATRHVVFQVTLDENLILRDGAMDRLARRVPLARGP